MNDLESHLNNPDASVVSFLNKQVLSFPLLLPADDFDKTLNAGIAELPPKFYKDWQTIKNEENNNIDKWLSLFRNTYHKTIAEKLINDEIEAAIESSLTEMKSDCGDYMNWYYKDAFSFNQISAITGRSIQEVIKEFQACRIGWQDVFSEKNILYPTAVLDEERLQWLADYFDNKINSQTTSRLVLQLSSSDANMQRSDALELWLRQFDSRRKTEKKQNINRGNSYLSADDFLRLAKEKIQQQRNQNIP